MAVFTRALRIDVDYEMHERVKKAAQVEMRSVNNWIRKAIAEKLSRDRLANR